jgi:membrane associated rhomboid family serine protease
MIPIRDSIRIPRAPVVTYGLILVNAAVFLYQISLPPQASYLLSVEYALVPQRYFDPAWARYYGLSPDNYWPFVTGTFMHGGWLHIILNMWTLYIFGSSLEGRLGRVPFLLFYLACGVAASFAHAWFNQDSSVPALGASGAIAGVTAAYAMTFPRARLLLLIPIVIIPFFFTIPALAFALIWFGIQFLQGAIDLVSPSMGGGIAWWAHIGGFVAGVVLIPFFWFGKDETRDVHDIRPTGPLNPRWRSGQRRTPDKTEDRAEKSSPWTRGPWG